MSEASVKLHSDSVTRAIWAIASTLPGIIVVFFVSLHLNTAEDMHRFIQQEVLALGSLLLVIAGAIGMTLIVVGLFIRKSNPESTVFVITGTQYVALNYTLWGVFIGPYTTPASLLIIGVLLTGYLLFDRKVVFFAVITTLLTLLIFEILQFFGIGYAPIFHTAPVLDGEFVPKWLILLRILFYIAFFTLIALFVMIYWRLNLYEQELQRLSTTDSLTGLSNRRSFMEKFGQEFQRNKRTYRSLSICMCDADFFKKINDKYGHLVGDEVLIGISKILDEQIRGGVDLASRLGGEEFALLLPETGLGEATAVAERVLAAIRDLRFESNGDRFGITISIGLVSAESGNRTPDELIAEADRNLYQAKSEGRDRLISSCL